MKSSVTMAEVLEIPKAKKERGAYGEGCVREQSNGNWQIAFYDDHGKRRKETFSTEAKARKALRTYLALRETGKLDAQESHVKIDTLADLYINKSKGTAPKSVAWIEMVWNVHLKPFFSGYRAERIDTVLLEKYQTGRLENAAPATVNRELAILRAMFYHAHNGYRPPKVTQVPRFPDKLKEANPRSGFLTDDQYNALQANCAHPSLRAMIAIAYDFGFRKGELLGLKVKQVDMESRTIQLLPGTTKNGKGRTVRMTDEVYELMKPCVHNKQAQDFVFTWTNGDPVRDFRSAWKTMCDAAGVKILLHDFRRTAVRNLIRAGVSKNVAKKISGHLTDSVFDRYDISDEADLEDASIKIQNRRQSAATSTNGNDSPKLAPMEQKGEHPQANR